MDRKEIFSPSEELYYLKASKVVGGNTWKTTSFRGSLFGAIGDIYLLLANQVKEETRREFGLIPQDIDKTLREGVERINTSMTTLLSVTQDINEQANFLNALEKIKNIDASKINTTREFRKAMLLASAESRKLSRYLVADYFKTNDVNKILNSIKNTEDELGGSMPRTTEGMKGAIQGHLSNMQGYFTEYLLTKSKKVGDNLADGLSIAQAIKAPKEKGKLVKADVIITYELQGTKVEMGVSVKTYLSESASQIKLSDKMNLGNLTPDTKVQAFVAKICQIAFQDKTQQLAARRLIAAIYIDEGQGGSGSGRALMSFVTTKGKKAGTLDLSTQYLYNYFFEYASRARSKGSIPLATLGGSLDFSGKQNILKNMTALIKGPIIKKEAKKDG
jgi:hypothetical protein